MQLRHIFLTILVVAIWGFNFAIIKLSVEALPPFLAAALRFFMAVFPVILFFPPPKNQSGKVPWLIIICFGLSFGFALYALLNFALFAGMPAGMGSLILQVQAFFTMVIAFFMLKERPNRVQIIGAIIAFLGIGTIGYYRWEGASLFPFILTILAALAWAFANIFTKMAGRINPVSFAIWGMAIASIPLFILSFLIEGFTEFFQFILQPDWQIFAIILFSAYPATLFGLAIWNYLLGIYPTANVAPFTLLVPISGLISGWLLLGETIAPLEIIGGILVITGLAIGLIRRS